MAEGCGRFPAQPWLDYRLGGDGVYDVETARRGECHAGCAEQQPLSLKSMSSCLPVGYPLSLLSKNQYIWEDTQIT